jgi:hypothetical protein
MATILGRESLHGVLFGAVLVGDELENLSTETDPPQFPKRLVPEALAVSWHSHAKQHLVSTIRQSRHGECSPEWLTSAMDKAAVAGFCSLDNQAFTTSAIHQLLLPYACSGAPLCAFSGPPWIGEPYCDWLKTLPTQRSGR